MRRKKILVIVAPSMQRARTWVSEANRRLHNIDRNWKYFSNPDMARGLRDGEFITTGSFQDQAQAELLSILHYAGFKERKVVL